MKKRLGIILGLFLLILVPFVNINAEESEEDATKDKVNIYMFRGDGCGFCESALEFFESISEEYGQYFELKTYEVWKDNNNQKLMNKVAKVMNDNLTGVPYIIIGNKTYNGFDKEKMGEEIINLIKSEYDKPVEERYDAIEIARQPVKRNILVDSLVVFGTLGIIGTIIILRYQNKKEQEV